MTIISIKTGADEDLRRIELSDGSLFSFKINYLPPVFLNDGLYTPGEPDVAEGREINADEEEGFRFASACLRAEKVALQLITRAEQTVFGLSHKLEKRGHDSACVRAVVARLCELGLVDDRRYARLWLESRLDRQASRSSSPRRLFAALRARGIDRRDTEAALKETLDAEAELRLLERYARKMRRKHGDDDDSAAARRALRYTLKSEGFSSSAIQIFFEE
ncbi:MAG: recombination regulator RecX [Treponema sp.]|jgi:regulatory protein|nr:recombination regulator RecX [Treponema sp.]